MLRYVKRRRITPFLHEKIRYMDKTLLYVKSCSISPLILYDDFIIFWKLEAITSISKD